MTYARNIWDMKVFNNKIYIGAGNSANKPPASNAGRVYVVSINPKNDKFKYEYKVAEEQINLFKIYDDTLYIPGHDATQRWDFGNLYEKQKNKEWMKYRTIPKALHVYDLIKLHDTFYVALGLEHDGAIFYSNSKKDWHTYKIYPHKRVYSIVALNNKIYSDRQIVGSKYKAIKITKLDDKSFLYIKVKEYNDHQYIPLSLQKGILKNKKLISKKINMHGYKIFDIIKHNNIIYILASKNNINSVFVYNTKIRKIISFKYNTFARSMELYNKCFYFGMGSFANDVKKETGDILKICDDKINQ